MPYPTVPRTVERSGLATTGRAARYLGPALFSFVVAIPVSATATDRPLPVSPGAESPGTVAEARCQDAELAEQAKRIELLEAGRVGLGCALSPTFSTAAPPRVTRE